MDFEILSEITEIQRIAVGSSIHDIATLRRKYGRGRWRKLKGWRRFGFGMDVFVWQNYTGTKLTASDART